MSRVTFTAPKYKFKLPVIWMKTGVTSCNNTKRPTLSSPKETSPPPPPRQLDPDYSGISHRPQILSLLSGMCLCRTEPLTSITTWECDVLRTATHLELRANIQNKSLLEENLTKSLIFQIITQPWLQTVGFTFVLLIWSYRPSLWFSLVWCDWLDTFLCGYKDAKSLRVPCRDAVPCPTTQEPG